MSPARPVVVSERPVPGTPRPYDFPTFERSRLANGLGLILVDLPGRPLVSASLVLRNGAADEPPEEAGATALSARALTEGTEQHDAIGLIEASERLGASLHAEAGWDAYTVGVDVPVERLGPALELLAEVVEQPTFPESEVERIRDERLNDLLQVKADPRRRAEEVFPDTIYTAASPYHRPAGGTRETVSALDRDRLAAAWRRGHDPERMTLIVGGDLTGIDVAAMAGALMGGWTRTPEARVGGPITSTSAVSERFVRVVHRPGSVQTEVRIGHQGLPRRVVDYHAVSLLGAILGGLFNSRLMMKLREEKGYTYGATAGFDLRRAAGPFAARAAVHTEVTVPAVLDTLAELSRIRTERVTATELRAARDFLVGVFPLRFETPGPVVAAIAGLVIHELPDDELARYRPAIEAQTVDDVLAAAEAHIHPERAAVVLVGDADAFLAELERAGIGPVRVDRDEGATGAGAAAEAEGAAENEGAAEAEGAAENEGAAEGDDRD